MEKLDFLTRSEKSILKRMLERMLFFKSPYRDPWYRNDQANRRSLQKAIILIKLGASFDAKSIFAGKILRTAAFHGNLEAVKYLLDKGVDINAVDRHKETPLCLAALNNHTEVVRILLERNADVNVVTDCNQTVLSHVSLSGKDPAIIELLKAKGAK